MRIATYHRLGLGIALIVIAGQAAGGFASAAAPRGALDPPRAIETFPTLPLRFEPNVGQTDPQVQFVARGRGYTLYLTGTEAVFVLGAGDGEARRTAIQMAAGGDGASRVAGVPVSDRSREPVTRGHTVLRMRLAHANPRPGVTGLDRLPGTVNYFLGHNPATWRTNIPTYATVRYQRVYPGVDLLYRGDTGHPEYDFIVAPGADPGVIRLTVDGADRLEVDAQGDLVLHTPRGAVRHRKPLVYQEVNGARSTIPGRYVLRGSGTRAGRAGRVARPGPARTIAFEVGAYDPSRPLVIDPVIVYSTYLGGNLNDVAAGIEVDPTGHAYLTGWTTSLDFPTADPLQPVYGGGPFDAVVAKLDPTGSALVYATYLGGDDTDGGYDLVVDADGRVYMAGITASADFPIVAPVQSDLRGRTDAFVAVLDPTGSELVSSTYLGGAHLEGATGIAVDAEGDAWVTGLTTSADFPTRQPVQATFGGSEDAFVSKLDLTRSALVYSTYMGGRNSDVGEGIALDAAGDAYVVGRTGSPDFPTTKAFQPEFGGGGPFDGDAFVARMAADGSALVYSTYLGGSDLDRGRGITADAAGHAYVTGTTRSLDFPVVNALQPEYPGGSANAFVTVLEPSGAALVYSTYLGATPGEEGRCIAVDQAGRAYVAGSTSSRDFPTVRPVQPAFGGFSDTFITVFDSAGSRLLFSTYLGGSSLDHPTAIRVAMDGSIFLAGYTWSSDFPTVNPLQPAFGGVADAFLVRLSPAVPENRRWTPSHAHVRTDRGPP